MKIDLSGRTDTFAEFWTERHLCSLATVRADGTPHLVPVGVTLDIPTSTARIITSRTSYKAKRILAAGEAGTPVAVNQVEGRHWSTLEGIAVLREDAESVRDAEERYARRYRQPKPNPERVVIEIAVSRVLGNV